MRLIFLIVQFTKPKIIIDKLARNEDPSGYKRHYFNKWQDLDHYLFIKNWRDIEQKVIDSGIKNQASLKFLEYLTKRFSTEIEDGFKVFL